MPSPHMLIASANDMYTTSHMHHDEKHIPWYTLGLLSSLTTGMFVFMFTCTTLFNMKHILASHYQHTDINCSYFIDLHDKNIKEKKLS